MRRYTIEVGGKVHTVDAQETAVDRFQVHIGGRALEVRLAAVRDVALAVISPEIAPQDPPQHAGRRQHRGPDRQRRRWRRAARTARPAVRGSGR